jgi:hypothetical protein
MPLRSMAEAMEHQFFIRQQNLKLYRSLVAASEVAAVKADARQEKLLKLARGSSERTARRSMPACAGARFLSETHEAPHE